LGSPIGIVDWVGKNEKIEELLNQENTLTVHAMEHGFEAEVMKISSEKESYVLKVWNKSSEPDISFQFCLLNALSTRGLSVSKPVGWGINPNADKVLLTTFDGMPVLKVNEKEMTAIAGILSRIHQVRVEEIEDIDLPKYDFIEYFFPGVRDHDDINSALSALLQIIQIKQDRIIHGDFHVGNIVEDNDRYTVIDWTNGQLGDSRYDFAWSLTLQRIYISYEHAQVFRSAYLLENDILQKDLEVCEALACLRWILLNRNGGVPKGLNTIEKVKGLIANNSFLQELEFRDLSIKKKIWSGDGMNIEAAFEQLPCLKSEGFVLKKIEDHHFNEVFEIYNNDKVFEYCGIIPKHNKDTVKSMIGHFERDYNKRSRVKWGIFASPEPDRLLGIIEAVDFNQKVNVVTIGYFLSEAHWGKGIASEAVKILINFLFMDVNVNRIQAEVMPLNETSKKVLLKNGFIKEGTLRQATLWAGKGIVDLEIYSILKEDYVK
jgi:RimJ/RimL family protein N-acetyltransferase